MKRLHIVGSKNSGKTTLMVELVCELVRRGYRIGTVKHSSHDHDADIPGKDSHRHRAAGANPAAFVTPTVTALYFPTPGGNDVYGRLAALYGDCDLVLVEGGLESESTKIEVWRSSTGTAPLAGLRGGIAAVVTDDATECAVPCWPRSDLRSVADRIVALMEIANPRHERLPELQGSAEWSSS